MVWCAVSENLWGIGVNGIRFKVIVNIISMFILFVSHFSHAFNLREERNALTLREDKMFESYEWLLNGFAFPLLYYRWGFLMLLKPNKHLMHSMLNCFARALIHSVFALVYHSVLSTQSHVIFQLNSQIFP